MEVGVPVWIRSEKEWKSGVIQATTEQKIVVAYHDSNCVPTTGIESVEEDLAPKPGKGNKVTNSLYNSSSVVAPSDILLACSSVTHRNTVLKNGDLYRLEHANKATILDILKNRCEMSKMYTMAGETLVSINPFTSTTNYSQEKMLHYAELYNRFVHDNIQPTVEPHIFIPAIKSMKNLLHGSSTTSSRQNQVIVISGESGSGKSENAKYLMNFIAYLSEKKSQNKEIIYVSKDKQTLLQAMNILESFGHARTCRNENSSRFGKFIKLQFSSCGALGGAKFQTHLLEKVRVVSHGKGERNFHIFYEIIAGLSIEEKKKYRLEDVNIFRYLNNSTTDEKEFFRDDQKHFTRTMASLTAVGFSDNEQNSIIRILSGLLHMGNMKMWDHGDNDAAQIRRSTLSNSKFLENEEFTHDEAMRLASEFLGLNVDSFQQVIRSKKIRAGIEYVIVHLSADQAQISRDALAKDIYANLFNWLVKRINRIISFDNSPSFIGVLDIFGFEAFQKNSLEQLFINYANEKLQQVFIDITIEDEESEYMREKIRWNKIEKLGGEERLALLHGKPFGILSLLDETCLMPKGCDSSFMNKLKMGCANNSYFLPYARSKNKAHNHRSQKSSSNVFTIFHYAGPVVYSVDGLCAKNKDQINTEAVLLMRESKNVLLAQIMEKQINVDVPRMRRPQRSSSVGTSLVRSASLDFKNQLGTLLETVKLCNIQFVRCFKPNDTSMPSLFDWGRMEQQLVSSGIIDALAVARKGYPVKLSYVSFIHRFQQIFPIIRECKVNDCLNEHPFGSLLYCSCRIVDQLLCEGASTSLKSQVNLNSSLDRQNKEVTEDELNLLNTAAENVGLQFGLTIIFLQQKSFEIFENILSKKRMKCSAQIQSSWRKFLSRKKLRSIKKAVYCINSWWRKCIRYRKSCALIFNHKVALFSTKFAARKIVKIMRAFIVCKIMTTTLSMIELQFQKKSLKIIQGLAFTWKRKTLRKKLLLTSPRPELDIKRKRSVNQVMEIELQAALKVQKQARKWLCLQLDRKNQLVESNYGKPEADYVKIKPQSFKSHQNLSEYDPTKCTDVKAVLSLQSQLQEWLDANANHVKIYRIIQVQSCVRKWLLVKDRGLNRNRFDKVRIQKDAAAVKLQASIRRWSAMIKYNYERLQIIKLQSHVRKWISVESYKQHKIQMITQERREAAVKLQASARRWLHMQKYTSGRLKLVKLQSFVRMWISMQSYKHERLEKYNQERDMAAVKVQSCARRWSHMQAYSSRRLKIIKLQSYVRMWLSYKQMRIRKNNQLKAIAAVLLQSHIRRWSTSQQYNSQRLKIIRLQSCVRMWISLKSYKQNRLQEYIQTRNLCAVIIQSHLRRRLAVNKYQYNRLQVTKIQKYFREWFSNIQLVRVSCKEVIAITRIQSYIRRSLCMAAYRKEIQHVILLQRYVRKWSSKALENNQQMEQVQMKACVQIQSHLRKRKCMKDYTAIVEKTILIQRRVRLWLNSTQSQALRYLEKQEDAELVVLQSHVRKKLCVIRYNRQKQALHGLKCFVQKWRKRRKQIVQLQTYVRMWQCQRTYQNQRKKTLLLQKFIRRNNGNKQNIIHSNKTDIFGNFVESEQVMFRSALQQPMHMHASESCMLNIGESELPLSCKGQVTCSNPEVANEIAGIDGRGVGEREEGETADLVNINLQEQHLGAAAGNQNQLNAEGEEEREPDSEMQSIEEQQEERRKHSMLMSSIQQNVSAAANLMTFMKQQTTTTPQAAATTTPEDRSNKLEDSVFQNLDNLLGGGSGGNGSSKTSKDFDGFDSTSLFGNRSSSSSSRTTATSEKSIHFNSSITTTEYDDVHSSDEDGDELRLSDFELDDDYLFYLEDDDDDLVTTQEDLNEEARDSFIKPDLDLLEEINQIYHQSLLMKKDANMEHQKQSISTDDKIVFDDEEDPDADSAGLRGRRLSLDLRSLNPAAMVSQGDVYSVSWNEGLLGLRLRNDPSRSILIVTKLTGKSSLLGIHLVQIGDYLLRVDGSELKGLSFAESINILKSTKKPCKLEFERGSGDISFLSSPQGASAPTATKINDISSVEENNIEVSAITCAEEAAGKSVAEPSKKFRLKNLSPNNSEIETDEDEEDDELELSSDSNSESDSDDGEEKSLSSLFTSSIAKKIAVKIEELQEAEAAKASSEISAVLTESYEVMWKKGPLGISLVANRELPYPQVTRIAKSTGNSDNSGSSKAHLVLPGHCLVNIGDYDTSSGSFNAAIKQLQRVSKPVALTFCPCSAQESMRPLLDSNVEYELTCGKKQPLGFTFKLRHPPVLVRDSNGNLVTEKPKKMEVVVADIGLAKSSKPLKPGKSNNYEDMRSGDVLLYLNDKKIDQEESLHDILHLLRHTKKPYILRFGKSEERLQEEFSSSASLESSEGRSQSNSNLPVAKKKKKSKLSLRDAKNIFTGNKEKITSKGPNDSVSPTHDVPSKRLKNPKPMQPSISGTTSTSTTPPPPIVASPAAPTPIVARSSSKSKEVETFTVNWMKGSLGMTLRPHPVTRMPVVARLTGKTTSNDIAKVRAGDVLVSANAVNIVPHEEFKQILEQLVKLKKPTVLKFSREAAEPQPNQRSTISAPNHQQHRSVNSSATHGQQHHRNTTVSGTHQSRDQSHSHQSLKSSSSLSTDKKKTIKINQRSNSSSGRLNSGKTYVYEWKTHQDLGIRFQEDFEYKIPVVVTIDPDLAGKEPKIAVGDFLVAINDIRLGREVRFAQAADLLASIKRPMNLVFQRKEMNNPAR